MARAKKVSFEGQPCIVCHTIDATATGTFPVCRKCKEISPIGVLRMSPAMQKRAAIFVGIGRAIEVLKPLLKSRRRR